MISVGTSGSIMSSSTKTACLSSSTRRSLNQEQSLSRIPQACLYARHLRTTRRKHLLQRWVLCTFQVPKALSLLPQTVSPGPVALGADNARIYQQFQRYTATELGLSHAWGSGKRPLVSAVPPPQTPYPGSAWHFTFHSPLMSAHHAQPSPPLLSHTEGQTDPFLDENCACPGFFLAPPPWVVASSGSLSLTGEEAWLCSHCLAYAIPAFLAVCGIHR